MPLRAAQIFVRCPSLEALADALERALHGEGPRPEERLYVALHEQEWGAVVLQEPDDALVQHLSEQFGVALALSLDGGQLAMSVRTWEAGQPGEDERDPQPPRFRDVEAKAWELLQSMAVPPSLRLLQLAEIEVHDGPGLPAVLARVDSEAVELRNVSALPPPRVEGPSPPAAPDVVVESKAGEARALEVRTLPPGLPMDSWARALAEIEEAQALRILRALADDDEERLPRPTFAYRSPQALRLEKLMAKARRERPWLARLSDPEREPPLSHAGFVKLCRARLSDAPVARAHARHLELNAGPASIRAPIAASYDQYLLSLDENGAADQAAEQSRALLGAQPPQISAEHLLPALIAGDPGDRASQPFLGEVQAGLLYDDGTWIVPVLARDLAAAGLTIQHAFRHAVANADALTDATPEGIRWFDVEHGRIVSCSFDDAGGAGRLLSAHVRELLLAILGEDEALVAAPTRDTLLACAASNDDGVEWLRDESLRRFREGPFPIHPGLFRVESGEVVAGDPRGGSDTPEGFQ